MSFPRIVSAIDAMIEKEAPFTPTARAIVRKAGLRRSDPPPPRPKTVIEGVMHPLEEYNGRVWLVDLTAMTEIRFGAESNVSVFLVQGLAPLGSIDSSVSVMQGITDLEATVSLSSSRAQSAAGDLGWLTIPEALRVPLILSLSTSSTTRELNPAILDGPFSFVVQVSASAL